MCIYGSKYDNFLLNSLFYDFYNFSPETEVRKSLLDLKNILNSDYNEILKYVSEELQPIVLNKNGFKFIGETNNFALKSIFTTFKKYNKNEEDKKINVNDVKYYPIVHLQNNSEDKIVYPDKKENDSLCKYKEYVENLNFKEIINSKNINFILNYLSNVLSYVPYFKDGECGIGDISFYDKLKINTALSSCLYLLKDRDNSYNVNVSDKNNFALLSGDISGIQKFIYTISSKGALKSLRARSFYLEIMLEHISDEILENFNLTRANLLYTGGGHFYIILPNYGELEKYKCNEKYDSRSIEDQIDVIMSKLNDWFIDNFSIDLYIAMGIEKFNFEDLKEFSSVFKKLSSRLTELKQRRYIHNGSKNQLEYLLKSNDNKYNECTICNSSLKPTKERIIINEDSEDKNQTNLGYVCNTCFSLYRTGKYMLSEGESIFVVNSNDNFKDYKIVDLPSLNYDKENKKTYKYLYFGESKEINDSNLIRAYTKNNKENKYINLFLGGYNFKEDEYDKNLIDFETLVNGTENNPTFGINRLAVLRCDVDSLGDAFMNGFKGYADILRTSSFSRHLSLFFKYYINFVCEGDNNKLKEKKRIVIVYSGGDDVFLVGHWLDVINFTLDLRHAFRKYTDNKLTFSAGIGFFHTKYPISKMASQTGELEDLAKENEGGKKDSVALFGIPRNYKYEYTFNWEEFKSIKEKIDFLFSVCYFGKEECDSKKEALLSSSYFRKEYDSNDNKNINKDDNKKKVLLSASMMYRLKQLIYLYQKDGDNINIARLAYSLARVKHSKDNEYNYNRFKNTIYNWFTDECKEIEDKKDVNDKKHKSVNKEIKYLNIALDLIIYLLRKE